MERSELFFNVIKYIFFEKIPLRNSGEKNVSF